MTDTTTTSTQDPKERGRVFAHEKNWGELDAHPNSRASKMAYGTLYFFGGREAGKLGLSDNDTAQFFIGLLEGAEEVAGGVTSTEAVAQVAERLGHTDIAGVQNYRHDG